MKDKKSGIFGNWLQNFTMLVFTQSFHAIFLVFILKMMSVVDAAQSEAGITDGRTSGILAIISIAGAMALIKFEKMIKQLFGIGDSKFMGGIGQNFASSLGAVISGKALLDRTTEPFKKYNENRKKANKLREKIKTMEGNTTPASGGTTTINAPQNNVNNTNANTNATSTDTAGTTALPNAGDNTANSGNGRISDLIAALEKNTNALADSTTAAKASAESDKADKLAELQQQLEETEAEKRVNLRQMFTRTGSTAAAAGFALGATDNLEKFALVTNLVDAPMDYATDKVIEKNVYKQQSKEIDNKIKNIRNSIDNDQNRARIKAENPTLDASGVDKEIEKAIKNATKGLENAKISIDDKVPEGLRKNLANVWKDVQSEVSRTPIRTKGGNTNRRSGTGSVDNI